MKFKNAITILNALCLAVSICLSFRADAAQVSGTLGASSVAVDGYTFACPTGTVEIRARVADPTTVLNTAAIIYATFGKDGNPTLTVSDSETTSTSSAWISNRADGAGTFSLIVRKSSINADDYLAEVQCLDSSLLTVIGPSRIITQINQ